ncbi:MAG: aminodeoxychorismate/anthranilate synthase component II [Candidatus Lindowbacteria bacterium RIFCSPLOWO2_12_FULL_62_27]|nr:MAG: aminodeoxychorismate/anthranilate synthase component II [Candidatus Lindowbacteria bacterium RIFCSPLOWO2_02_FULL_62_12]OGH62983.1 MAG: aminodeoxychorismate/anthranilate synthase component II [Candidatus Lindowbacteria bacterium RIFCSPLOWO2_12_FULL_62_27]
MILVIDNYDSFVYNLVQYVGTFRKDVRVARNDELTVEDVGRLRPHGIILSPGPGRPETAGICVPLIRAYSGRIPILGVCLGHQALGIAFGARVVRAGDIVHGKTSVIRVLRPSRLFSGLPRRFQATRYHSLVVTHKTVAPPLTVTAKTADGKYVMALEVSKHRTFGVQFHPESIETHVGLDIVRNFLKLC